MTLNQNERCTIPLVLICKKNTNNLPNKEEDIYFRKLLPYYLNLPRLKESENILSTYLISSLKLKKYSRQGGC